MLWGSICRNRVWLRVFWTARRSQLTLKNFMLAAWVVAAFVGWIPGLPEVAVTSVSIMFPQARFRPAMFATIPEYVTVVDWFDGVRWHELGDVDRTGGIGYTRARTSMTVTAYPGWLGYLCAVRPELQQGVVRVRSMSVDGGNSADSVRSLDCRGGRLNSR